MDIRFFRENFIPGRHVRSKSGRNSLERKVDETAEAALKQIHDNGYCDRYINTEKTVHLIGLNFTSEKRQVDSWVEEALDKTKQPSYLG